MARKADNSLFGKTFDQQLQIVGKEIGDHDISPNRRIQGEVVFEPLTTGVRVTARNQNHKELWGFVASKEMIDKPHSEVAIYETLRSLISEELEKRGFSAPDEGDPIQEAKRALSALQETLDALKSSISVKEVSPATLRRAQAIKRSVSDAIRMMSLESALHTGSK
jgi:hypothetical protein